MLALILCGVPALMAGIYFMGRNNKYRRSSVEYRAYSAIIGWTGGIFLLAVFFLGKYLIAFVW